MLPIRLDASLTQDLRARCSREGVSLFMLITAAWAVVLARLSRQEDLVIGTLSANRGRREIEPLIGFFVSTLALRLDVSGDPDTTEILGRVRRTILAAQDNQDLPFEQIVEIARPSRRLDHSPLFQVLFAWQSNDKSAFELPGIQVRQAPMSLESIRYDLELHLYEEGDAVIGALGYATALFDEATIERHRGYLVTILEAMASDSGLPMRTPLPGTDERALLARWNDTATRYPQIDGVHRLFEQQARQSPDAIALIQGSRQLSYAQLDTLAHDWARRLRASGIGRNQRVALCVDRGFAMVAALLAILKAGACYVPLDPSYPNERLSQILSEAKPSLLIVDEVGRLALGEPTLERHALFDLNRPTDDSGAGTDLIVADEATAEDLAYVIYTSGSTGTPKGVAMPHRPLVNLVQWQIEASMRAGMPAPRSLQFAALGFDVAFQEIFTTLGSGASLVLVDTQARYQFAALIDLLRQQRVERLFLPYIALQALAEAMDADPDVEPLHDLKDIIVAGEQLRLTPQIQHLFRKLPCCALHNHYGPTETHVVTAQTLDAESIADAPSHVPIGRPIANARTYLLDRHGLPVPVGTIGELYIGGIGVARGYLDRPDLTEARFLNDPFDEREGARMYRTGDLARYLPDGRLVFLGRDDHQVKVRGFRIELGEIETRLAEHPQVRECAVIARQDARGDTQLVAYVVATSTTKGLPGEWHAHLARALPTYMLPTAFVRMPAIPLTSHGKLDRNALPAPDEQAYARTSYEPPQGDVEVALATLWQNLLGVTQVGRNDHFFELGGHSLVAVRLISRMTQAFGVALPLATLFAQPVLRDLARALESVQEQATPTAHSVIPVSPRHGALPLSHAQQRLWFLAQMDGASARYHIPMAVRLEGELDVPMLREAMRRVFARHESLRTVVTNEHGRPYARVLGVDTAVPWHDIDLGETEDIEGALATFLAEDRNRPFDLATGPLVRVSLARLGHRRHVLQLTFHHIVADGWSLGVLARELSDFHADACQARTSALPPLPIQFIDYAAWERDQMTHGRLSVQATFWREQLAGVPTSIDLPTDYPRPSRQSFEGGFVPLDIDPALTQDLKRLAQRHGVTLFIVVLAAWAVVLSRLARQQDLVIGTPTAGRGRQELESLIGFFVNTLALRIDLSQSCDTTALLSQVRRVALDAQANQDLPFDQVVDLGAEPY
ncbi:peptide synthetase, partial [Aureobasidium melanogenum]